MREIKFRAWDKENRRMIYPTVLTLRYLPREKAGVLIQIDDQYLYGTEDVLMQFTGLRDKNGKEIYEGDIVRSEERWTTEGGRLSALKVHIAVVEWFDYVIGGHLAGDIIDHEVIGNIYENPDLIKQSSKLPGNSL